MQCCYLRICLLVQTMTFTSIGLLCVSRLVSFIQSCIDSYLLSIVLSSFRFFCRLSIILILTTNQISLASCYILLHYFTTEMQEMRTCKLFYALNLVLTSLFTTKLSIGSV